MISSDITNEKKKQRNANLPQIPDHLYRILIVGGSRSVETNAVLNLINHQPDIDKIYLLVKDPCELKYQLVINESKKAGLYYLKVLKAFMEYSSDVCYVYKRIKEYNPGRK